MQKSLNINKFYNTRCRFFLKKKETVATFKIQRKLRNNSVVIEF